MAEVKHTPGPWRYSRKLEDEFEEDRICFLRGSCVIASDKVEWYHDESNGCLISAAPDLLDTLKSVAQRVHQAHHEGEPADCSKSVCLDIRNAIKKAEG